jgi:hypothetical protein
MITWKPFRFAVLALFSLNLAGCFKAAEPLIVPGEADFPFETLTYVEESGSDAITLVRAGDAYRPANENTNDRVMFKVLGPDTYLVQLTSSHDDETLHLYGFIKLTADRSGFVMATAVAGTEDLAAIWSGYDGLSLCEDDPDTICIENLDAYIAYSVQDSVMSRGKAYRIVSMK